MQYTMYYEEQQKIDYDEYGRLKQQLLQKEENQKFEKYTLRKLKFRGDESNDAVPHYYLCVKNQDEDAIYLEKKYMQMHIWHRACAKLNRTDCDRILRGDIEWMKDSKEALFQDFYLQATLNHLSPGNVIEYQKERLKCKEGYVAFVKKVRCVVGFYGTYTYTHSRIEDFNFEGRENEEGLSMPGSPAHTANASLYFEKAGLNIRLSYNFASEFIDEMGESAFYDRYYDNLNSSTLL